jgi:cell division protein ZapA (FtsZ GTPase activity inhibitor)
LEQLVTIDLFGKQHTFKADSEVNQAKEIADLLAKEVARVENQQSGESSPQSNLTTLMLAALNIAHQNMELENRFSKFLEDLSERSDRLIRKLDDCIEEKRTLFTS